MAEVDIDKYRQALAGALIDGTDTHAPFIDLLCAKVPLKDKFKVLNFVGMLSQNSESADNIKRLIQGLNILEKYGKHLLKPVEIRSNMWRHIKYSNNIFRDRVDTLQGGREVMSLMGYSENKPDGVAFPDGAEPDHGRVLNLVIDIYQGRKELEKFLEKQHPKPQSIIQHLAPKFRAQFQQEGTYMPMIDDTSTQQPHASTSTEVTGPPQHPRPQPRASLEPPLSMRPSATHGGHQELGTSGSQSMQPMQDYGRGSHQATTNNMVPGYAAPHNTLARPQQSSSPARQILYHQQQQQQQPPYFQQQPQIYQRQSEDITQQSEARFPPEQPNPMTNQSALMFQQPAVDQSQQGYPVIGQSNLRAMQNSELPYPAGVAGYMPSSLANVVNLGARPKTPQQNGNLDPVTESPIEEAENKQASIVCDICNSAADVLCQQCDNKALCQGCNSKWHNHPRRQNHNFQRIHPEKPLSPSSNTDDTTPISNAQQPPSRQEPHIPCQGGNMYPDKPYAHVYGPYGQSGGHFAPTSPPIRTNVDIPAHITSSYVYNGQGIPGTVGYHPSMMPHTPHQIYHGAGQFGPTSFIPGQMHPQSYVPAATSHVSMTNPYFVGVPPSSAANLATQHLPVSSAPDFEHPHLMHGSSSDGNIRGANYGPGSIQPRPETPGAFPRSSSSPKVQSRDNSSSLRNSMSTSALLQKIMLVPDKEKRLSKVEITVGNLKDDLDDWELELNDIMMNNENFIQDDRYLSLSKKKRKHLHEKKQLESYKAQLQQEINEAETVKNEEDWARAQMRQHELLKQRFKEIGKKDQVAAMTGYPVYDTPFVTPQGPPVSTANDKPPPSPYVVVTGSPDMGSNTDTFVYSHSNASKQGTDHQQTAFQTPAVQVPAVSSAYQQASETPPDLGLDSLKDDTNMAEIRQMLVLDQNPFEGKKKGSPAASKGKPQNEPVLFPPNIDKTLPAKQGGGNLNIDILEQPNIQQNIHQPHKNEGWECDHCTYMNPASTNVCEICFKTSDTKRVIDSTRPVPNQTPVDNRPATQREYDPSAYEATPSEAFPVSEACEHCTYENPVGSKVCTICNRSQSRYQNIKDPVLEHYEAGYQESAGAVNMAADPAFTNSKEEMATGRPVNMTAAAIESSVEKKREETQPVQREVPAGGEDPGNMAEASSQAAAAGVGHLIDEEQDRVFLEKKAAQLRFLQSQQESFEMVGREDTVAHSEAAKLAKQARRSPLFGRSHKSGSKQEHLLVGPGDGKTRSGSFGKKSDCSDNSGKLPSPRLVSGNKDLDKVRDDARSTESSGDQYVSAPTSLDPNDIEVNLTTEVEGSLVKVKVAPGQGVAGKPELSLAETIEKINIRRDQEQMNIDGHDLLNLIKEAECSGYEISEVEIALRMSTDMNMRPLDWLHNVWSNMAIQVADIVMAAGQQSDQNNIGELSNHEAKLALIECEGNIDLAVNKCITERKDKFTKASENGGFAREDILTALREMDGNVDDTVDQLNTKALQNFSDRVWNPEERGAGDAALLAAGQMMGTDSMSNSVIGDEDFRKIVENTAIDKERRTRMIFVEGKLRSWGRAQVVINILDNDITNSDDPLECTLEDIIEAVRNCGDRRSSLVYLKQECGACFSYFPMPKIRKLTCLCNLCESCLQQNFILAIKEKHIRNWGCPLCEAPGLEDETSASEYFEFLSLLLNNIVPKDVMDLFETKLRDWHLQKDPNFRWCAHCAAGFLGDANHRLDMTCPSCGKKTCFQCKKMWEEPHKGLTCEQFTQWKIDNDPERQAKGVQLYLEENGIDCPSCKMRYSLAKGGCMHFKCPQCGYEFCSGCSQAFVKQDCKVLKSCRGKGLHCHHPRDCYYYLRDNDTPELQSLLKMHKIAFNTETPATQEDSEHCPIMLQNEYDSHKKDEACNKDTQPNMAGLCEGHYKEYLVSLINKHTIDPVEIMTVQQMVILIQRKEKEPPKQRQNEQEPAYAKRLVQFIKERWTLQR